MTPNPNASIKIKKPGSEDQKISLPQLIEVLGSRHPRLPVILEELQSRKPVEIDGMTISTTDPVFV